MLDIFKNNMFSTTSLTHSINVVPNMYGRLGELNVMPSVGVSTTSITIENQNGVLNLLPTGERGGEASKGVSGKRSALSFEIPHIPHEDVIKAADVQNVREFGSEDKLQGVLTVTNNKLVSMRMKHAITLEHMRMGAISGIILDADGSEIHNLFTRFNITEKEVNFDFAGSPNVDQSCMDVVRHIQDNLLGDIMSYVHALCSPEFMDSLLSDAKVREAYLHYQSKQDPNRLDVTTKFVHKGILFEEYRGSATYLAPDGTKTTRKFIPAGEARFFPMGTQSTFSTSFAPADFNETVNTLGLEVYAKMEPMKFGRGMEIHTQSNPLPICCRPATLVKGKSAA